MNNVEIFKSTEFGEVRVLEINGNPWFVAKDVADILGYSETAMMTRRLDDDEISKFASADLADSNPKARELTIINESGLYNAIIGSKKPESKRFKKWVTSEVLPSIRKKGSYSIDETKRLPGNFIEALEMLVVSEKEKMALESENKQLLVLNDEMKPKAEFYDTVTQSITWIDFAAVAKLINKKNFGRNNLMDFLRKKGVLQYSNLPYQYGVDRGYFKIVENPYPMKGEIAIGLKTVVSQKGVDYINKILNGGEDESQE